jgi:hypothetical protein
VPQVRGGLCGVPLVPRPLFGMRILPLDPNALLVASVGAGLGGALDVGRTDFPLQVVALDAARAEPRAAVPDRGVRPAAELRLGWRGRRPRRARRRVAQGLF